MVTYYNGDLLESGCEMICHQVNEFGVMGAGIALQIKNKYKNNFIEYKNFCDKLKNNLYGKIFICFKNNPIIANCFSQKGWKTDYNLVKQVCINLLEICKQYDIKKIGIPYKYGCGLAGGDWTIVEKIFKDTFEKEKYIDLQIWRYKC